MSFARLKDSFAKVSQCGADKDTISLLGQKVVTYKISNDVESTEGYKTNKYLYIVTYSVMAISLGCYETFGASIYTELGQQLHVRTDVIAFIFVCKSIAFGASAILYAWIADCFHETHRYISFTMLLSSASIVIIPYTHDTFMMYVLFIVIGYSLGAMFVCFPVYIFRLYPASQSLMIYILLSIYGVTKVVLPLIIELSIAITAKYNLVLIAIAVITFFDCICLLLVTTPPHDELRTVRADISNHTKPKYKLPQNDTRNHIKTTDKSVLETTSPFGNISDDHTMDNRTSEDHTMQSIKANSQLNTFGIHPHRADSYAPNSDIIIESQTELEDISNQVCFVLRNNRTLVVYEYIIVILLSIDMALHSATQSGLPVFITTYCDMYLHINISNGRFMIACYFLGQLLYRLIFAVFIGDKYKELFSPKKTISLGFAVMTVCSLVFVIWPNDLMVLYAVYSLSGAFGGMIFPDIYKWCEYMKPVSGVLSCFYIIGFSGGDAIIVLIIGKMFEEVGAYILPTSILIANVMGVALTLCIVALYRKYEKHKFAVLCTFYHGN